MNTEIVKAATVAELVTAYRLAVADLQEAFRLIGQAEERLKGAFVFKDGRRSIYFTTNRYSAAHVSSAHIDTVLELLRRDTWRFLFERLDIRRTMSIKRYEEWDKKMRDDWKDLPEITVENVNAFVQHQAASLPDLFEEAVVEVFEWLRPWRSEYKTNSLEEIGPKVILNGMIEDQRWSTKWRINYNRQQNLTALENVFSGLDGKGTVNKRYRSVLEDAIEASEDGRGETEYFAFKAYKKGTLHLRFKRLDLLKKLNQIAGGKNLKRRNTA